MDVHELKTEIEALFDGEPLKMSRCYSDLPGERVTPIKFMFTVSLPFSGAEEALCRTMLEQVTARYPDREGKRLMWRTYPHIQQNIESMTISCRLGVFNNQGGSGMRFLTEHQVNMANDTIVIAVTDEPGAGGANHEYAVSALNHTVLIKFQNGPINEVGVNGLTHEALLAIVSDRLRSFQKGPYSCKANACALTHIEEAQHWLQQRTLERMRRGVEGTHTV